MTFMECIHTIFQIAKIHFFLLVTMKKRLEKIEA